MNRIKLYYIIKAMARQLVYFLAGVGLGTIGSSVYFFNYMKKQNEEEHAKFAALQDQVLKISPKPAPRATIPQPIAVPKPVPAKTQSVPAPIKPVTKENAPLPIPPESVPKAPAAPAAKPEISIKEPTVIVPSTEKSKGPVIVPAKEAPKDKKPEPPK